jgi:hypothetical protein
MKQGQWKLITMLIAFMMAISLSTSIFVYAETPEEQHRKKEQPQPQEQQKQQQQQKRQQEQLRKQPEQQKQKQQQEQLKRQQHPTGPTAGGLRPETQPQTGHPPVRKQPSQPKMQPGQSGDPGRQQPGQYRQRQVGQPGTGPTQGQPDAKTGRPGQGPNQKNMNVRQRTTINIKQPPQERQRVLTERHREIRPEHNARAVVRFQSERARFKPASRVVVRYSPEIRRSVFQKHHFHPETYHARRAAFYETYRFRTPVWAFGLQPRFGLWDTPALAFIVAHAEDEQYARWYYSHRFDPDVIAWRQEMNRLAAANAELADQLAVMDAKTRELQARGEQVDNSYVPPEMEDIALAAEVAIPTQDQNDQAPPDQPQQYEQYQKPQQYQQPAPLLPPASYQTAADIGFVLSAAQRDGDVVTLSVRLKNTAGDGRSVALYDDNYRWPKSRLIDESGRSYEVREVYFRKGAERIPMYDTGKTGIPIEGGATVTVHLVFKEISDGSRRATLNLHPFIYYGSRWTEHEVNFPDIALK